MQARQRGTSALERLEAILCNPALHELAGRIPDPDPSAGGRPRHYPTYMWLAFEAMISVFGSARQVEAELSHPVVWTHVRDVVSKLFPDDPSNRLPEKPMQRHHYLYCRTRYLADPEILAALWESHRECAGRQALEIGLMDPESRGSWSHPHADRMLYADGKVVTPLFRAKPGDVSVDRTTGEVRTVRHEPDAGLHFEGHGEFTWGMKFVLVAARKEDPHGRIILDSEWVPRQGGEMRAAMKCFRRLAPLLPGVQALTYDTALRGVHSQEILRDLGWIPVNRVTAASVNGNRKTRTEKSRFIETKRLRTKDGLRDVNLYARGGAIGIGELDDRGGLHFLPLERLKTHRAKDQRGRHRWYNEYRVPLNYGGKTVIVRLDTTEADRARGLNRTENVRVISPIDKDFEALFRRRNDAESINRGIDDTLYLRRAHSVGHARQWVNLLGFAIMTNGLALHRYRARPPEEQAA